MTPSTLFRPSPRRWLAKSRRRKNFIPTQTKQEIMKPHYRQGDVLIRRVDSINKTNPMERENGRVILAHGEVTGHAHAIADEAVQQYRTAEPGVTALEIETAIAMLKHEEHGTIEIPKGTYEVIRQREYTPTAIVNVAD